MEERIARVFSFLASHENRANFYIEPCDRFCVALNNHTNQKEIWSWHEHCIETLYDGFK